MVEKANNIGETQELHEVAITLSLLDSLLFSSCILYF